MAGQTIETVITVDAKQAQAEVAKFAGKLSEVEQHANTTSGRLDALQKSAKGLQEKMGPAAAAISSVSAALGASGGEAGKVVAVVGQLAAAFGAGGPLGVAVVAATTAVDYLTKSWEAEIKAQDEALKKTYSAVEKQIDLLRKAREETDKIRREMQPEEWRTSADRKKAREEISKEIESFNAQREARRRRVSELPEEAARLDAELRLLESRRNETEKQFELQDRAERYRKAEAEQVEFNNKKREDEAKKLDAARVAREKYNQRIADTSEILIASMEEEERQLREAAKMRREAAAEREKLELERMGMSLSGGFVSNEIRGAGAGTQGAAATTEMQAMAVEAAINAQMAEDWSLAWIKAGGDVADSFGDLQSVATGTLSTLTAGTQQYLDDVITGQENAEAALAAMLMRTAGQALIGSGIDLGGRAVVSAFTPGLQPLAAAQGAAAAGLIASGIALGGTATGIEHMAAGGQIGKPLPDKESATDRGASPRSSRGGGDGGPIVINISYGVGGPLPEDTAREIARVQRTGNRRSGA